MYCSPTTVNSEQGSKHKVLGNFWIFCGTGARMCRVEAGANGNEHGAPPEPQMMMAASGHVTPTWSLGYHKRTKKHVLDT